ncbi:MAG TPA: DNA polymerase III subunit gamma/tau [Acidimicrobiales bacterium]|nr:DNA polymerase III subunit gamma/tau [Acidimicrobiales bacterium]
MALVGDPASAPYQSLYRRFRPQRFAEVLGQEHISLALRNAVRDDRVGHAYLFSGPRGTGKTSTARILAKALNCAAPEGGEPCGTCDSCIEIARGTSLDVHELDAASNNGVDAMRELVSHAALGTPGRWKVYIVDEVHMLSTAASNALLKTLEEPPSHVVFVLATTEAQKVLPTIRSRTQHFEFRLLGPETLVDLLRKVRDDAGLDLGDESIDAAVRRGRGSARDALSALDQVAAGGTVDDEFDMLSALADALAERDPGGALVCVAQASEAGHDMAQLAGALADHLRQAFLASVAPDLVTVPGTERVQVEELARKMGLAAVVRHMEVLGKAQVDMRESPDPRVHLEVVLIRLTHPEADDSPAALLERIERLERGQAQGQDGQGGQGQGVGPADREGAGTVTARRSPRPAPATGEAGRTGPPAEPPAGPPVTDGPDDTTTAGGSDVSGPELARRTLGEIRRKTPGRGARGRAETGGPTPEPAPAPAPEPGPEPVSLSSPAPVPVSGAPSAPAGGPGAAEVSRDTLVQLWGDRLLASLPNRARARFRVGRFVAVEEGTAVFALPNETHRSYCEDVRIEVEAALGKHFGTPVPLRLVVDDEAVGESRAAGGAAGPAGGSAPPPEADAGHDAGQPDLLDPEVLAAETELAGAALSPEERLKQAFPGAEEV